MGDRNIRRRSFQRSLVRGSLLAVALVIVSAQAARAEGILSAFVGTTFGGETEEKATVFGGVLGGVRAGAGLGFEIDFGYAPDFFGNEDETGVETSLTTVMGNLVIGGGTGRGGAAPFVSGGVGLIRANVSSVGDVLRDLGSNEFGLNIGGGVNIALGPALGLRGDLRYFRSLADSEDADSFLGLELDTFDFWRASVGVLVRW